MVTEGGVWCGGQKITMVTEEVMPFSCEPLHQVASCVSLHGVQHFLGGVQCATSGPLLLYLILLCNLTFAVTSYSPWRK